MEEPPLSLQTLELTELLSQRTAATCVDRPIRAVGITSLKLLLLLLRRSTRHRHFCAQTSFGAQHINVESQITRLE
jgi:hypothetical protein